MKVDWELFEFINHEIDETENLLEHMGEGFVLGDKVDLAEDIKIMRMKVDTFKTAKGMIKKSALKVDGLDNFMMMNVNERRMFMKIVKFISWFKG